MIWENKEKDIRINEINDDMLSFHMFATDYILGLIITREEVESMCSALTEWCGLPTLDNKADKCDVSRGCDEQYDDDISS